MYIIKRENSMPYLCNFCLVRLIFLFRKYIITEMLFAECVIIFVVSYIPLLCSFLPLGCFWLFVIHDGSVKTLLNKGKTVCLFVYFMNIVLYRMYNRNLNKSNQQICEGKITSMHVCVCVWGGER